MKAIHLLAPATIALSAALNPASAAEPARTESVSATLAEGSRRPSSTRKATLIRTELINSTRERRILGCDDCGSIFTYYVTVLTLRDVFSDGTSKTRYHSAGA